MKALLFSGGIDSTALAWGIRPDKFLFVDYGQLSAVGERRAASAIARQIGFHLDEITIDARRLGHGTMVGGAALSAVAPEFWPFRNQFLVTIAAMRYANEALDALVIGSVAGDEIHPDGTAEFRHALGELLKVQAGPRLEVPSAGMTSEAIVAHYQVPAAVLAWTYSCHTGEWACGSCRGCHKHNEIISAVKPTEP